MHRITHVAAAISHTSGGVGPAVIAHAERQHEMGQATRIVCLGEESDGSAKVRRGIEVARLPRIRSGAFGFSIQFISRILCWQPAIVHAHGLWMYPGIAARIAAAKAQIPLIISPHGMLDPWALKNSAWKKKIAGWLYENRNLRSAACIHALCESEYQSIRAYGLKNPVCIIPNGVDLPGSTETQMAPPWEPQVGTDKHVMLFLGRIHLKKGLENLIRAWGILKNTKLAELKQWHLVIAGWSQGGHEEELKHLVNELNLEADVTFSGPLYDTQKDAALRAAKAFVLPSFSEGLPMAVLEAWSYGLPVLMTKFCNIPDGFEAKAAVEIQPQPDSIAEGLKEFVALSTDQQKQIGQNGLELVEDRFAWPRIAAQMIDVYKWVLGQGDRPDCIRLN